jgi:hypothetical protein
MPAEAPWISVQRHGRVVLVHLRRVANDDAELGQMTDFLDTSHRQCQAPLLMLGLPSLGLAPPSDEQRHRILSKIKQRFAARVIEQAFLVIPTGNFLKRALVRSLFTGIRLTQGLHNRVFLFDNLEAAVRDLGTRHGVPYAEVLAAATALLASDR